MLPAWARYAIGWRRYLSQPRHHPSATEERHACPRAYKVDPKFVSFRSYNKPSIESDLLDFFDQRTLEPLLQHFAETLRRLAAQAT
jgi:hypothetical protein